MRNSKLSKVCELSKAHLNFKLNPAELLEHYSTHTIPQTVVKTQIQTELKVIKDIISKQIKGKWQTDGDIVTISTTSRDDPGSVIFKLCLLKHTI